MSLSQGLQWSLRGVSTGRYRTIPGKSSLRHYSLTAHSIPLPSSRSTRISSLRNTYHPTQQSRSLSFFGWGSKPASNGPADTLSSTTTADTSQAASATTDAVRTVKASHGTSTAPDPSTIQPHLANEHTPEALQRLENAIINPHGIVPPAEQISEIPDLASIPERIGYLKEVCALDFGWGPSAIIEWALEHLHITAGLSWSASIIVFGLIFRGVLIWPSFRAFDQAAKTKELAPLLTPLQEKSKAAVAQGDRNTAMEVQREMSAMRKEYGLSFTTIFAPILLQLPFQFGAFRVLSSAGNLPVPAFEVEHWLWLTNISTTDPTYALPLMISGVTYLNMSRLVKDQPQNQIAKYMRTGLPLLSFAFMIWQPAALHLFFLVNGIFQYGQQTLFNTPLFRSWTGLAAAVPAPKPIAAQKGPTYGGMKTVASREVPATSSESNRSFIDQKVDKVKNLWSDSSVVTGLKNSSKASAIKEANKQSKARQEKWELQRQDELEAARRERNSKVPR
ncbi:hypothetical protein LTR84_012323 [Exophiala bonariae]|uniref:Membrane insertase YidC/Oxa/ALB C-terminal domain-containing protein n=1 Tax=Exophiala bonariae TaxID=1690606 RepID=A0AAV9NGB4_9EURO|nr:hypothetical protein LTR84_012323 [Exophiala bonariae]